MTSTAVPISSFTHSSIGRAFARLLIPCILLQGLPPAAAYAAPTAPAPIAVRGNGGAAAVSVFGPKDYVRETGKPVVVTDTFAVANPGTFALRIDNGGALRQYPRVSSAVVTLNGAVVAAPHEFSQDVHVLTKVITLAAQNTLRVELRSIPGSGITVNILGEAAGNRAPTADAGPDQTSRTGQIVTLDGSRSSDADGDALRYQWSTVALPPGSGAILSDLSAVRPTFTVDVPGTYEFELIVNDASLSGAPDRVRVTTENSAPVANAGADQAARIGQTVTLDGSGSTDPDGDALTYQWTMVTRPAASDAVLSDPTALKPTFVVDAPGAYDIRLMVNDGRLLSAPDAVRVTTENSPPVANAGADQTKRVGTIVTLDGSGSSDVDGDGLTYRWSLQSVPPGSMAMVVDANTVSPRFTIDVPGAYIAQLIVNDGTADSAPDTVSVTTENSPPVANAGADRTAVVGTQVTLDGSQSSDVDGDALTFRWNFMSKPAGSAAMLSDSAAVSPAFVIDLPGAYVVQLVVNDGTVDSGPDTVTVSTINSAPVANAGADQSGVVGATITLNGSGSSDVDGDALTYAWSFQSKPAASAALLSDPTAVSPTFVIDVPGTYIAQLIVNDGTVSSAPGTAVITTLNSAPVANAGADQTAFVGDAVTLNGLGSHDADGNALSYQWSFVSRPVGSTATLSDLSSPTPAFMVDAAGEYVVQLIVNDGAVDSAPDTIKVSTLNTRPLANAGADQTVTVGNTVTLDGSGSSDVDGNALTYHWSVLSQPAGSAVTLSDSTVLSPTFVPAVGGVYVFQLIVNDGQEDSTPDSVMVTARAVVPDVVALNQAAAEAAITAAGLVVGALTTEHSDVVAAGLVIRQSPAGGTVVAAGSAVDLVVSLGPAPVVVPDVVGMDQAVAEAAIVAADLVVGVITRENSGTVPAGQVISQAPAGGSSVPRGSAVDLVVSLGPAVPGLRSITVAPGGQTLARGEKQQYTATGVFSDGHTENLTATVTWESTNGPIASITAGGLAEALDPGATTIRATRNAIAGSTLLTVSGATLTSIAVSPANPMLLTGSTQPFTATGILSDGTSQNLTTEVIWESTNTAVATIGAGGLASTVAAGATTIKATKGTLAGSTGLQVQQLEGASALPSGTLTSPAEGALISGPTNIVGTANDANFLRYVLEIAPAGTTSYTTIGGGTAPVVNGSLGTIDPTLLVNGQYEVRLSVFDRSGGVTRSTVIVETTGEQKIGNFSLRFVDLNVPMAGVPITVVRTYDSRLKRSGDFGFSWQLDIQTMRPSVARVFGTNWQQTRTGGILPNHCLVETKPHTVSITMADGTLYRFRATTTPSCQQIVPIQFVTIGYAPMAGTTGSLVPLDAIDAFYQGGIPGTGELIDIDTFAPINPRRFQLTTADGHLIAMNTTTGVESIQDPNGNRVTFTAGGIQHSSGASVAFTRDAQARITKITDPNGNTINYAYDANGDLIAHTDAAGNITRFAYNMSHGLIDVRDPRGLRPIRNEYDDAGRLLKTIDAFGNAIQYQHDLNARREVVTDRLGNATVEEYDASGNVLRTTDPLGAVINRSYDARGNQLTEQNALGKTTTNTFDATDNQTSETDPLGNKTTYTYNARGEALTLADPLNQVTTNTYDAKGNLLTLRDPQGNLTTNTYDGRGLQLTSTDPLGKLTRFEYDGAGRQTRRIDANNNETRFTYDSNGNILTETKRRAVGGDLVTRFEYDKSNRATKVTFPDGSTRQTTYNSIGKAIAQIDQLGRQTTYAYDAMGRLIRTTNPDGTTELATYDQEGRRTSSTDRAGRITTFEYDKVGRQIKTTLPDGTFTSTEYDLAGQVKKVTDALGNVTAYEYDDAGRRTKITNALNQITTLGYDKAGNQVSFTDANSNLTTYQYDRNNRRTRTNFPDSTFSEMTYDAAGHVIAKRDQAGVTTQYEYDAVGRLVTVIDALSQETSYTYDEVGNRLTQTDANGRTTQFAYDALGRRVRRTLPGGQFETFTYDAASNLASRTDFNGKTTTYGYDPMDRLTAKVPDATLAQPGVTFGYTPTGRRAQMNDPSGITSYAYDSRDRLIEKATPQGTLTYGYDGAGNIVGLRSSNAQGTSVDYTYDVLNRVSTVVDNRLAAGTTTYAYDEVGNLRSYQYPNAVKHEYSYNPSNRLTTLSVTNAAATVASFAYTLGPAGNRLAVTENSGRRADYTFDALYRLTSETITGGTENGVVGYSYDAVGNRLQRTSTVAPVPAASHVYDVNDRLSSDTYDNNGNTLVSNGNVFTFDFENRLTTMNAGGVSIVYDGDGNRVVRTAGGVTTRYLVDERNLTGYVQVLEELVGGAVTRRYTYGLDLVSQARLDGTPGVDFYVYDGTGSTRLLTDAAGVATDAWDWDAFGNLLRRTGSTPNNYLFGGEQYDPALGMYFMRARYLNAATGRFLTMDQFEGRLEDPASLHRYLYADNDPINNFDPTGNFTMMQVAIAIDIIGTLASLSFGIYNLFQGNYKEAAIDFALVAFWGVAGLRKGLSALKWWIKGRQVRVIYNTSVHAMEASISSMRAAGKGAKEIAEVVVQNRNEAKVAARALMDPADVAKLEARNMALYGNPVGPSLQQLIAKGETYGSIIESSLHTNFWYNLLFLSF